MSLDSRRVLRLLHLREKQHLLITMDLRSAQQALIQEEEAATNIARQAESARDNLHQAPQTGMQHDWLMACAHAELCNGAAALHNLRRVRAQQAVSEVAQREAGAHTASKQMERMFDRARGVEAHAGSRAELFRLDEVARNLSRFSKARNSGRLV